VAPSGATTILSISSASVNKSGNGNRTTKNGGTTTCGGVGASIITRGPLFAFNLVVEFFHELQGNYQRVKTKKIQSLQDLLSKPHENLQQAYAQMCRLIMVTQGVMEA
jgi:hypothetical protein